MPSTMLWGAFPALLSGRAGAGGPPALALTRIGHVGGARLSRQAVDRQRAALERSQRSQRR